MDKFLFDGCINRKWYFVGMMVVGLFAKSLGNVGHIMPWDTFIALLIALIAVELLLVSKRLRDIGKWSAWAALPLVAYMEGVQLLVNNPLVGVLLSAPVGLSLLLIAGKEKSVN